MSGMTPGIACIDQLPMRMSSFSPVIGHHCCKVFVVFVGRVIVHICV